MDAVDRLLISFRYQAHYANQMVNIFRKWSLLDVSDKPRLSKIFHRELHVSIILSHVSVTSNHR